MRKITYFLTTVSVVVALLLPSMAWAQDTSAPEPPPVPVNYQQAFPTVPAGGSLYFIPQLMKGAPRPWSAPELKLLHAGMTMLKASTADAWCVNLLNVGVVRGAADFCLGGTLYPSLVNKDVAVSAAGWQDGQALAVQGQPLNLTTPDVINKRIILGNVILDGGPLFEFGKEQQVGVIPIFLSNNVNAAGTDQQTTLDEIELLRRINRIRQDNRLYFGVPIPIEYPVYEWSGTFPSNLAARCTPEQLEGQSTWPWLPATVLLGGAAPLASGEWGFASYLHPVDGYWTVRRCMDVFKFIRWDQITKDEVFADFRIAVMTSKLLADPVPPRYRIETWGDTEKGGNWYIQIFPAAAGAVVVAAQYLQQVQGVLQPVLGVIDSAWLVIPDPNSKLMCGIMNDPTICALGTIQ